MRKFFEENWTLLFSEVLVIVAFCLFYGSYGDVTIDSFREAYISKQMLSGEILYKNIFCIYPPLGYLINEILFKIFGANLNVIYIAGLFAAMGIFYFTDKTSKMFCNDLLCLGINLFLLSGLVLSPNVFNAFFPYSSGVMYGLLFTLGSLYFALNKKFSISYFLCALALCSKAEFVLLVPALMYFSKRESLLKNFISFIIPILAVMVILFVQGVRLSDLLLAFNLIQLIGGTESINNFYFSMGLLPNIAHIPIYAINFVKFIFPINWNLYQEVIIWAFPAIFCLFLFRYKKLNISERFFVIAALLVSLKVFFAMNLQSYGVYFLPFALISAGISLNNNYRKIFTILLIVWSLIIGFYNSKTLSLKNYTIRSSTGIIKTKSALGQDLDHVIDYIKKISPDSTVVVYPECLGVNFLANRKSDNKFYSLIPLYVETFGEDLIIKRLEKFPPDYIVISDYDTSAYGYKQFGKNYGINIYNYILKHYKPIKNVSNGKFLIYLNVRT